MQAYRALYRALFVSAVIDQWWLSNRMAVFGRQWMEDRRVTKGIEQAFGHALGELEPHNILNLHVQDQPDTESAALAFSIHRNRCMSPTTYCTVQYIVAII